MRYQRYHSATLVSRAEIASAVSSTSTPWWRDGVFAPYTASMRPSLQTQLACDCGPTSFVECVPELSGSSPRQIAYNTIEERVLWTPNGA